MDIQITPELVASVARTAKLSLSQEELHKFTQDFKDILELFSLLDEVKIDGNISLHSIPVENAVREDKQTSCLETEEVFLNDKGRNGYFVSPLIKK